MMHSNQSENGVPGLLPEFHFVIGCMGYARTCAHAQSGVYLCQRGMVSERDCEAANTLTLLAKANLSSVHLHADLRNLIGDYFWAPADDLSEVDSDSGSDDDDDEAEREVPAAAAAAESDSEEEGKSVDEVSVVLKDVSTTFISEDAAKEADTSQV